MDPRKILFFKFGAMGDILMTTPLIRQTRKAFPQAHLEYWVGQSYEGVLGGNPSLDIVRSFDPAIFTEKKLVRLWRLAQELREGKFDLVFVLDKHWSFSLMAWLAGIPIRVGFIRETCSRFFLTKAILYGAVRHEIHYYLDLLEALMPVNRADTKTDFVSATNMALIHGLPKSYVVCVNSGGKNLREQSAIRMLPMALFAVLLTKLLMRQNVVLLGNEEDRVWYESLVLPDTLPYPISNLAGKLNLQESTAVMALAQHVYCTDSGAMHLAGTTTTPLTLFFGPTHPLRKAPLRPDVETVWADEEIYDSDYEVQGRIPAGKVFFKRITIRVNKASKK